MRKHQTLVRQALNYALSAVAGALILVLILLVAYSSSGAEPPGFILLSIVGLISIATALVTALYVVLSLGGDALQR